MLFNKIIEPYKTYFSYDIKAGCSKIPIKMKGFQRRMNSHLGQRWDPLLWCRLIFRHPYQFFSKRFKVFTFFFFGKILLKHVCDIFNLLMKPFLSDPQFLLQQCKIIPNSSACVLIVHDNLQKIFHFQFSYEVVCCRVVSVWAYKKIGPMWKSPAKIGKIWTFVCGFLSAVFWQKLWESK